MAGRGAECVLWLWACLVLQVCCAYDQYWYSHDSAAPAVRCGQTIGSLSLKKGTIESPNYPGPYPSDLTCSFKFEGVGRERIQLRFVHMDLFYPSGDAKNPAGCAGSDSISVYVTREGHNDLLDTYCGGRLPPMLMSNSHNMTVVFRSLHFSSDVTGFRANFEFVTNFGITSGNQDSRGTCVFNYMSHKEPEGHFMSPNYAGLYPRDTECHYLFYGRGSERVHITFLYFEVDGISPRCEEHTKSDYVSFSNFAETEDRKLYRMCGQEPLSQHKVESDGSFFRVTFKSNHLYDGHGFQAFYQFFGGAEPTVRPGAGQISNTNWEDSGGGSSPGAGAGPPLTGSASLLLLCLLVSSLLAIPATASLSPLSFLLLLPPHRQLALS